jgi:hypothetical protein
MLARDGRRREIGGRRGCHQGRPRHAGSCSQQDGHIPQPRQPDAPPPQPQVWPRSAVRSRGPQMQQSWPYPVQKAQRVQIMQLLLYCSWGIGGCACAGELGT